MGFRGNNRGTFAEYVELEIAIDEYSPNAYLFKRLDSETNKPVSERTWYIRIPIPNKGNGKRLSLRTSELPIAKKKALPNLYFSIHIPWSSCDSCMLYTLIN